MSKSEKLNKKIETSQRGEWYNEIDQNHPNTPTKGDVSCLQWGNALRWAGGGQGSPAGYRAGRAPRAKPLARADLWRSLFLRRSVRQHVRPEGALSYHGGLLRLRLLQRLPRRAGRQPRRAAAVRRAGGAHPSGNWTPPADTAIGRSRTRLILCPL